MSFLKTKESGEAQVDFDRLPRHVAIIMDGNGRWAKRRGLPRTAGHAAGAETFRSIATYCQKIGLEYLTVYAFSTENWKRPLEEVSAIVGLLKKYLLESIEKMEKDKIKLHFFGDLEPLPQELKDMCLAKPARFPSGMRGCRSTSASTMGARDEIVRAARRFRRRLRGGRTETGGADRGAVFRIPLLQWCTRPGSGDPPQRGSAHFQLPAVAVRPMRNLFY